MSQNIQHKRSSIPGTVPSGTQLLPGELAINTADSKVFLNSTFNNRVVGLTDNIDGGKIHNILYFVNFESTPTVDLSNINLWFAINPGEIPFTPYNIPANRLPTKDDYVLIYSPPNTMVTGNITVAGAKLVSTVPGSAFPDFPTFYGTINGDTNIGNWRVSESIINGDVLFWNSSARLDENTIINGNVTATNVSSCEISSGTINGNVFWESSRAFNNVNGNVILTTDMYESTGITQNIVGNLTINSAGFFNNLNVTGNVYHNGGDSILNFTINGDVYITNGEIGYGNINGNLYLTECGNIRLYDIGQGTLNVSGDCRISNYQTSCNPVAHLINDGSILNIGGDLSCDTVMNANILNSSGDGTINVGGNIILNNAFSINSSNNLIINITNNHSITLNDTSSITYLYGGFGLTINGNVVLYDTSTLSACIIYGNIVLYDTSVFNDGTVSGNVIIYNNASVQNINGSTINGDITINNSGVYAGEGGSVFGLLTLNDYATITSPSSLTVASTGLIDIIFNNNSYNQGTITGECSFYNSSYNDGTINIPSTRSGCTFYDSSRNISLIIGLTPGQNCTFNNSSYNGGAVMGDGTCIFNDNSYIIYSSIYANTIFNDNAKMFSSDIYASATFNDSSCYIDGSATTFIPDPPPSCASLLLHFDGSLVDSGKDLLGVSGVNGVTTSSTQSKFGTESLFCNGGYARIDNSSSLILNNSDFTIECFVYIPVLDPGTTNAHTVFSHRTSDSSSSGIFFFIDTSGNLRCFVANSSGNNWVVENHSFGCSVVENTWHHVALVRNNGTITLYLDGSPCSNSISIGSDSIGASGPFNIGCASDKINYSPIYGNNDFIGYIDEFRFIKSAVYRSSFPPPSAPFKPPF